MKLIVPERKAVIVVDSICTKREFDRIDIIKDLSIIRDTTTVFEELENGVIRGISVNKSNNVPYIKLRYDSLSNKGANFSILGTKLQLRLRNPTLIIKRKRSDLDIEFDYYIEDIYNITGSRERFEDSDVIYILSVTSIFHVIDFMRYRDVQYVIIDYRLEVLDNLLS